VSRFLSSFKRLSRKISRLEVQNLTGNIGPALAEHARTGALPQEPWLQKKVLYLVNVALAMNSTVPRPLPENKGAESS
jgi:hypothetical protein